MLFLLIILLLKNALVLSDFSLKGIFLSKSLLYYLYNIHMKYIKCNMKFSYFNLHDSNVSLRLGQHTFPLRYSYAVGKNRIKICHWVYKNIYLLILCFQNIEINHL